MEYPGIINTGIFVLLVYIMQIIFNLLIWIIIIKTIVNSFRRVKNRNYFKSNVIRNDDINYNNTYRSSNKTPKTYNDVNKQKLAKFNIDDINTLKDYFYNKFLEFEKAYNNLDVNTIKLLSTKEVFYNYQTGIDLDLKVGKKRIIDEIERKQVIIFELDSTIAKQIATVMIEISYINYTINKKGMVISGSRNEKVTERFEVAFRKDFERKEITKCPTCGAGISGNKCEYCRSTIHNVDFKISSIKRIID